MEVGKKVEIQCSSDLQERSSVEKARVSFSGNLLICNYPIPLLNLLEPPTGNNEIIHELH